MAKRKCAICGKWIEDNNKSVPYKKRYAHLNCFNVAMKVVTTEKKPKSTKAVQKNTKKAPQKEVKTGLTEEEYQEKKQLCDFIREKTKADITIKIYKLIDDYIKKYKVTYKDIYETLYWYYSIESNEVKGDMIGIFPYIYDEAKNAMDNIRGAQKNCQEKMSEMISMYPEKVLKLPDIENRIIDQIDISKIGE